MAGLPRSPLSPLALALAVALAMALTADLASGASPPKSPRLVGGLLDADESDEGVRRALEFAMSEYNKASNDAYHSRPVQLLRARKQVVSGMNYFLEVEIGRTTCSKADPKLAECPFLEQPHLKKRTVCSFHIYTVPWMGSISLVRSSCQDA